MCNGLHFENCRARNQRYFRLSLIANENALMLILSANELAFHCIVLKLNANEYTLETTTQSRKYFAPPMVQGVDSSRNRHSRHRYR